MPSKPGFRSRLKGFFQRDDASTQDGEIQQDDRHGQASTTASLVNSSALPTGSALPTRPTSPTGSTLATRSTLLASTSSTPTTLAERLWDQAYDDLKIRDAALIQAYEKILSSKLGGVTPERNIIAQNDTHTRRDQMRQLIHGGLEKTVKEAKVKEVIGTATEFIFAAKEMISSAVQAAPQAALAWTGVCVALEIMQNPIAATKANREGIEYVIKRMNMYWELSGVVLKENSNDDNLSGIRRELETQVIDLYKVLLLYEIKSVCSYYRNRGLALLRDIISLDDWNGDIQAIQNAERVFHDDFETFARLETISDIKQLVAHAEIQSTTQITKKDRQCIRDLRLSDPADDKKRIEQTKGGLLQESYTWVLDNPEYQQWQNSEESPLLWIKGDPGKGKTMLLCGIIDELNKQSNQSGRGVSYFFCQATDQQLNNASATLRGLIFMLVNQQPSLISHLREKYDPAGEKLFEGPNTWIALSDIFTAILQDPALKSTYLVVDALDECVCDFEKLLDLIVHASDIGARVKWIVSSRNWSQIEERLQLAEQKVNLSLELNAESISTAVNIYIGNKMNELSQLKGYDEKTREAVRDYLTRNANDTFLWVALVCQNLQKYRRWEVLEMLQEFPPGLDSLYKRMMDQVLNMDNYGRANLCRQILAVMMSVYRPVTLQELGSLVETRQELSIDDSKDIIALCGSFLTIRGDTIYFVHQSAKDYLSENEDVIIPSGHGHVHHSIFSLSLQAMKKSLRKNICGLSYLGLLVNDGIGMPDTDPLSAVRYSCIHWVDHLREAYTKGMNAIHGNDLDDDGVVLSFLRKHLLHWLEALGLLQQMSAGVISMVSLESLLSAKSLKGELLLFLQDTRRFILFNRRAIEIAPLQTYSSALAFSPMQSAVRKAFYDEVPSWLQKWPDVEDNWSPCLQTLEGHTSFVLSVASTADRKQIASGSYDTTIKIWDTTTGACIQTLKGHTAPVYAIVFLANGQIASGSDDKTIKIWDIAAGVCIQTLKGHSDWVRLIAVLANNQIASGSADATVKIWDIATGACVQTLKGHIGPVRSIAVLANGQIASVSGDETIKIWDIAAGACVQTLKVHKDNMLSIAVLANGQIASGTYNKTIKIWDIAAGACVQTFEGHKKAITSIAVLANGQIALGSDDKIIKIWDIAAGAYIQTLEGHTGQVMSLVFLQHGQIVSGSDDKTIKIWDISISTSARNFDSHDDVVWSMASSSGGRRVASASADRTIKVWDVDTDTCIQTLEGHTGDVISVVFLQHGQVASGSNDRTVKIWDVDTGACVQTFEGHRHWVRSIASSADGQYLASGSYDNAVKIWDVAAGVCVRTLEGHNEWVDSVAFSMDAQQLASGSHDKTIKIWDVSAGACTHTLEGHTKDVTSLAFSADGRYLASGSDDETVKVWNIAAEACIQTLDVGTVHHLSFDPTMNSRIYSSHGILELDLDLDVDPTALVNEQRSKSPIQPVAVRGYGIDRSHEWITKDGKPLLWLPAEYRPTVARIVGSQTIIVCKSGRVIALEFSEAWPES